jgi:hypothetical protein
MTIHNYPANGGRWWHWPLGVAAGNIVTALLYVGIVVLAEKIGQKYGGDSHFNSLVVLGLPSFFLVPICGGVAASFCWRKLDPDFRHIVFATFIMTLLALGFSALAFGEGIICLLIVSPLFLGSLLAGALIGRTWFRKSSGPAQWCLLPVLALTATGEPLTRSDQAAVVVDEIRIAAPPSKVWPQLTAFPDIQTAPQFWLFRMGLPYPMSTTSSGDYVGADRQCIFSDNMVFEEKVVTCIPKVDLTFDITKLPQHPELIGHITPSRGQFLLRDNGDGTTTLIGSTWYTLHVRPLWYFDWWTRHIFRAVHLRVMHDIRDRAEQG